jgi:hypothetical protein
VRPGDGRPLLADVEAQQPALGAHAPGQGQRRRAGERTDLEGPAGVDRPGQDLEQSGLIVADLHARGVAGPFGRDLSQLQLHLVRRAGVLAGVVGDGRGDVAGAAAGGHAADMLRTERCGRAKGRAEVPSARPFKPAR